MTHSRHKIIYSTPVLKRSFKKYIMGKDHKYKITARTSDEFTDIKTRVDGLPMPVREQVFSAEYAIDRHVCATLSISWGDPRVVIIPEGPLDIERTEKGMYTFYYKGFSLRTADIVDGRVLIKFCKADA